MNAKRIAIVLLFAATLALMPSVNRIHAEGADISAEFTRTAIQSK